MSKFIDLTSRRFGRLIVVRRVNNNKWGHVLWLCGCDCGKEKIVVGTSLKNADIQSCGCLQKNITIQRSTKHGHSKRGKVSKTYRTWYAMTQRCTNPKHRHYHNYGGRGVKVCERWIKFENFLEDMGESPAQYHSIDRINNCGNYDKQNCVWADRKQQARNKRNNHLETYDNRTQCLASWAEEYGIKYKTLCSRILIHNWSIEKALTTPVRRMKKNG